MKTEKSRLFAGIDAGGEKKGYHVALCREDGRVTDLARFFLAEEVSAYLSNTSPVAVAIDGPSRSDRLWRILRKCLTETPLLQTFPTAIHDRLLTEDVILPVSLLQSRVLRTHRNNLLDAVLCAALARRHILSGGEFPGIGDEPGSMILPVNPFREYSLTIVHSEKRILLGMKKRGIGKGYWNGFGGKIEPGETRFEAAARELNEESGLNVTLSDLMPAGILHFTFADGTHPIKGFVFRAERFSGDLRESDEMRPRWFDLDSIPYNQMWADDILWLPLMLAKKPFVASFQMGKNHSPVQRSLVCSQDAIRQFGPQRGKRRRPSLSM